MDRLLKKIKNKKGFTLVELVVVFALIGLIMASAAMVLSRFSQTFVQANVLSQEQGVASTVMQSICSELGAAKADGASFPAEAGTVSEDGSLKIVTETNGSSSVWFIDDRKYAVKMYLENGYLRYTYYNVDAADDTDSNKDGMVTTGLGEGAYHGCVIRSMKVTKMDGGQTEKNNCLTVTLEISNEKLGNDHIYRMSRTFACYNLKESNIVV